jgi:hypothetical protein
MTPDHEDTVALLEAKLEELGPVDVTNPLSWPATLSFDKLTPELYEIVRSRYLTALTTNNALQGEIQVLTEVIQNLTK